jgi:hypothetical protein
MRREVTKIEVPVKVRPTNKEDSFRLFEVVLDSNIPYVYEGDDTYILLHGYQLYKLEKSGIEYEIVEG